MISKSSSAIKKLSISNAIDVTGDSIQLEVSLQSHLNLNSSNSSRVVGAHDAGS